MSGFQCFFWIINQAEVHDLDTRTLEFFLHGANMTFEARLESFELRPVSVEADAEKSDAKITFHLNSFTKQYLAYRFDSASQQQECCHRNEIKHRKF